MRIGIDARFYGTLGKGLGRYTQQLIEHLEEIDTKNTYYIFLRTENFDAYTPKRSNFTKVRTDIPWYSWKEQLFFSKLLLGYHLDLMHFTHFNVPLLYRKPFVLTVHDLILFHFPTLRSTTRSVAGYGIKYLAYRIILRSAIARAKHIIAVSRYTQDDIVQNFIVDPKKITVTYQAATLSKEAGLPTETPYKTLTKYGILKRYFLYVGNAYPHKNLEKLLEAFQTLQEVPVQLVLVGKRDYFYDRIHQFVKKEKIQNVLFTGEVSDDELAHLYRGAVAYVFPSLYEGFGLPPLEAMAQGTPVLSSRKTALPEILGSAAHYFDPENVSDMAKALRTILDDATLRTTLISAGHRRVRKFSWKKLAEDTKKIYTDIHI